MPQIKAFLKHVRVMIIDEVHIFLHNERGQQLSYLRHWLELQAMGALQTIALSATISNFEDVISFFHLKHAFTYQQSGMRTLEPCWVYLEDEQRELIPFFDDLFFSMEMPKTVGFCQ